MSSKSTIIYNVHASVVVNFLSQLIFSFPLLLWMFSFVLHSLPFITTKENWKSTEIKKITTTYTISTVFYRHHMLILVNKLVENLGK